MIYEKIDVSGYETLQNKYQLSSISAKILASKHLDDTLIKQLLYDMMTTNDFDLSFLDAVCDRLYQAKMNHEKILICGDYDCDGVCATTILYDALKQYGCDCGYYIPDRFVEGYGVHINTMKKAVEKDYRIIITVDNGVKATEALRYAKDHGLCVILSDHHNYDEEDLVYDYFVHPNVFPTFFGKVSGAGVAYLLSKKLIGDNAYHTVLACIATIGDIVGVLDANRVIIKEGLRLLNSRSFPHIDLLADNRNRWDVTKIAFQIVPKINALGRLADKANVNTFVKYLIMDNTPSLNKVADQIKKLNDERKKISSYCETLALEQVREEDDFHIIYNENFHEGLNGIVASKLSNKFHQPCMILSVKDGMLKGSIRSVGIDLTTFFDDFKNSLTSYGGHEMAAGIALPLEELDNLIAYSNQKMKTAYKEEHKSYIELDLQEVTIDSVEDIKQLEPFGSDFEKPKFKLQDKIMSMSCLSDGVHLKFVSDKVSYLYFNHGHLIEQYKTKNLSFIGDLSINEFYNKKSINMIVDDVIE